MHLKYDRANHLRCYSIGSFTANSYWPIDSPADHHTLGVNIILSKRSDLRPSDWNLEILKAEICLTSKADGDTQCHVIGCGDASAVSSIIINVNRTRDLSLWFDVSNAQIC
jgi:hypothetical protein